LLLDGAHGEHADEVRRRPGSTRGGPPRRPPLARARPGPGGGPGGGGVPGARPWRGPGLCGAMAGASVLSYAAVTEPTRATFDDIKVGEEFVSPGRTVSETDIVVFACRSGG